MTTQQIERPTGEAPPPAGAKNWIAAHKKAVVAFGAAAVVVAACAIVAPGTVGAIQHANADSAYQGARKAASASWTRSQSLLAALTSAEKTAAADNDAFADLVSADPNAAFLGQSSHTALAAAAARAKSLSGQDPAGAFGGGPRPNGGKDSHPYTVKGVGEILAPDGVTAPIFRGTKQSTTQQLQNYAKQLNSQTAAAEAAGKTARTDLDTYVSGHRQIQAVLAQIVAGNPKAKPAIPSIAEDAAAVLKAVGQAPAAQQAAITQTAQAAIAGQKAGKSLAPLVQAYLKAAGAAKSSNDAAVAAAQAAAAQAAQAAAAAAGQSSYTDPSTGQSVSTYSGGNDSGSGSGGGSYSGGGSGGSSSAPSGSGSGGGSSSGSGGGGSAPAPAPAPAPVSGYPVFDGSPAPVGSSGDNCGGPGVDIPSNATVTGQGAQGGCWDVQWTVPF